MISERSSSFYDHVQAVYHGKPVVGMPFFGDQPSNADRVVAKVMHILYTNSGSCCSSFCGSFMRLILVGMYKSAAKWDLSYDREAAAYHGHTAEDCLSM